MVPTRLLDTRDGTGGTLGAVASGQTAQVTVAGAQGVPAGVGAAIAGENAATAQDLVDAQVAGPWHLAATGTYDDVIEPAELRTALLQSLAVGVRTEDPGAPR